MKNIFSQLSDMIHGDVAAIILCAGDSTRFSSGKESKQMVEVLGKSVIVRTIEAFEKSHSIREIILVVRKEDTAEYNKLICDYAFKKISCIVVGGDTRQISAMRGFKHASEKSNYVAFHDGARCLVTPEIIESVVKTAKQTKAATAATHMSDTIKVADDDGNIVKTVDRELLWTVQTPQIFEKDLYRSCIENAITKSISATDDCMLAEAYGQRVKLVETGKENIKITYKSDVALAEAILSIREEIDE
ncbi:MAG: 2-C-methyl-D-erythritol 4-phosphate cytidylyltransferase [Clostridia bacterium]|nr:2-C-methyl-D-erythritol 4-phosphate cytidylyltransferase [Clostridia bacterium]